MPHFFLSSQKIIYSFIAVTISLFVLPFPLSLLVLIPFLALFFFFRKRKILLEDHPLQKGEVLRAPVDGKVISISQGVSLDNELKLVIQFMVYPWGPWGVYLPLRGEIREMESGEGKNFLRGRSFIVDENKVNSFTESRLKVSDDMGRDVELRTVKCPLGGKARFLVNPGDRGHVLANIGLQVGGGTLLVILPHNCEVFVTEGKIVRAGEDLIAGFKVD